MPGDQLRIKVVKRHKKLSVWKFVGRGDGASTSSAAEATISAKIMEPVSRMTEVHPTAVVDPRAELSEDVVDRPLLRGRPGRPAGPAACGWSPTS